MSAARGSRVAAVDQLRHPVQVDPLQRKAGQFAAVGEGHGGPQRRVAADRMDRVHRPGQQQIGQVIPPGLFDQVQHQRRGAQLQVGRRLGEVGVADDDVQPAVFVGVGVRFVAGVDDAALERGLQPDLDLDVVGALGQLETGLVAGLPDADPAGAGDHLAGHQKRGQAGDDRRKRRLPHIR